MISPTTGVPLSATADVDPLLPFHFESDVELNGSADAIFSLLDDHSRLSAHMTKPSWMMAGSVMTLECDASNGRAVGAKISLQGRVWGFPLSVEEIVTERNPPLRKVWSTIGKPQLVVIGSYRMGSRSPQELALRICVCSSIMPCQTAPFLIGSATCWATFTPAGAPNV